MNAASGVDEAQPLENAGQGVAHAALCEGEFFFRNWRTSISYRLNTRPTWADHCARDRGAGSQKKPASTNRTTSACKPRATRRLTSRSADAAALNP